MAKVVLNTNVKELAKKLGTMTKKLENMTPAFKDIADLELMETKLRYKKEIAPDGTPWPVPFTIRRGEYTETGSGARTKTSAWSKVDAWKYVVASRYHATPPGWRFFNEAFGDKILMDTGLLFKSLGRAFGKNYAIVGSNRSYSKAVQDGSGRRKARPYLGINQQTYNNVETVMKSYIKGVLK